MGNILGAIIIVLIVAYYSGLFGWISDMNSFKAKYEELQTKYNSLIIEYEKLKKEHHRVQTSFERMHK